MKSTGMVGINEGAISYDLSPFGGVKESGIGREVRVTTLQLSPRSFQCDMLFRAGATAWKSI